MGINKKKFILNKTGGVCARCGKPLVLELEGYQQPNPNWSDFSDALYKDNYNRRKYEQQHDDGDDRSGDQDTVLSELLQLDGYTLVEELQDRANDTYYIDRHEYQCTEGFHCDLQSNCARCILMHEKNQDTHWHEMYELNQLDNTPLELMTVDHFIPQAQGGRNNIENLIPMCSRCNFDKNNTIYNPYDLPYLKEKYQTELYLQL